MPGIRRLTVAAAILTASTLGALTYAATACTSRTVDHSDTAAVVTPASQSTPSTVKRAPVAACSKPAPSSAAGYAKLWASLPAAQWQAADVSISVPLPDGRDVWLYGDTFSTGRFAHSTAIVQHGGCLHVSHAGAQLLPNDDAHHIYWIDSARYTAGHVVIVARGITLSKGVFGFKDAGFSRTATVTVTPAGDLTVTAWSAKRTSPAPVQPFITCPVAPHAAGHLCYATHTHPEARLASGRTLVTTCQNWTTLHRVEDYRPTWTEVQA